MTRRAVLVLVAAGIAMGMIAITVVIRNQSVKKPTVAAALQRVFIPPQPFASPAVAYDHYHAARQAVLQTHPELQAEFNGILHRMDDRQKQFDAAMVKADPQAARALAKLAKLRQSTLVEAAPKTPGTSSAKAAALPVMTPQDWQEVQKARAFALAANPSLKMLIEQTARELDGFETKLSTLMIKASPDLAPFIAQRDAQRRQPVANHVRK